MDATTPHVIVVGGGFGGLTVTRELAPAARDGDLRLTLVDRRNHHTFQPLLYQVATAGLQPQDVGHPLRPILAPRRRWPWQPTTPRDAIAVRLAEVVDVDREARTVTLDDGDVLGYDHLVVAAGAVTADFGLPGVSEHGYGLKSIGEALALRDHVLRRFEEAAAHPEDVDESQLTFVVAGGGPTGVELAGVQASPLAESLDTPSARGGRVEVTPALHLPGDPRVHVVGDVAAARDVDGELLPQLAPVALQQGRYVAERLTRSVRGEPPVDAPFRYVDKGTMATIGRRDAVAELPFGLRFSGTPAWLAWLGLHLLFLVGFRNRVAVLLSWVWNYLTYDRAARLILHRDTQLEDAGP